MDKVFPEYVVEAASVKGDRLTISADAPFLAGCVLDAVINSREYQVGAVLGVNDDGTKELCALFAGGGDDGTNTETLDQLETQFREKLGIVGTSPLSREFAGSVA